MTGSMFVLPDSGDLIEMRREGYLTEDQLQDFLARFPRLLGSSDPGSPRRWLLIRREAGLAGDEAGGARWAMDHLFVDQDGVPTIVEVKRGTDTRIRREVVGQMLDYAANAVVYLPPERLRAWFEEGCREKQLEPAEVMSEAFGPTVDEDAYWGQVTTNLQAGRIRLIFVADTPGW